MKILVIIPCYNERESVVNVVRNLEKNCPRADYIIINDCSSDDTKDILKAHQLNFLDLPMNLGIGGGVQAGYKYALQNDYDIAIQIDGDGQHDTAYLEDLVRPIEEGTADIVFGSRFLTKEGFQSTGLRRFGIGFLSGLIRLCCGAKVKDVTSGYRAVNREYIKIYSQDYPTDYPEPEALVKATCCGARVLEVPVIMKEREEGTSSINAWRSVYYMIKVSLSIILCRLSNSKKRRTKS